jgi:hypothetical protein
MRINDGLNNKCAVINKRETITLECSNPSCKRPLLIVHHTTAESDKIKYNLRVNCPACTRRSFDFEVRGDLQYVPANNIVITGIEENHSLNIVTFKTQKDR